jgi:hypothetical protein
MYIPATAACSTENLPRKNSAISRQNERMNSMRVDGELGLKPPDLSLEKTKLILYSIP